MSSVSQYLKERFPLQAVVPLSGGTAVWLVGITRGATTPAASAIICGLVALGFIAFLLRQRVTDEYKDRHHDAAHYPDRPVPRGLIKPRTLVVLGITSLITELGSVVAATILLNRLWVAPIYLVVLGFSILTAYEFFVPDWLERHFNIYFVSHQLIFVCYSIWACALFGTEPEVGVILALTAFVLQLASLEVIRKFEVRLNPQGEPVRDTYLTVWGRWLSVGLLAAAAISQGALLSAWTQTPVALTVGIVTAFVVLLARRLDKLVQAAIVLSFLIQGLGVWFS